MNNVVLIIICGEEHTHIHTHIYTHTYTFTHIHTHTHTHTQIRIVWGGSGDLWVGWGEGYIL